MNPEDIKFGIMGYGGAGKAQLGHFNQISGCRVTAIFDPKPAGLERARQGAPSAQVTDDLETFMSAEMDAVAVCSPDKTHADYIVRLLAAGIHVVCEKPLADSIEDCRRILEAHQAAPGVVAGVQHQMRCLPVHQDMKQVIDSGALGTISYIEGYYVHNIVRRASVYDDWRFTDNATPLVYAGCHFVDLFRWFLGEEVEEVTAMANHRSFPEYPESDLNVVLMRFKSGIIAKLVVAFGAARPQDHSVRIYGDRACIDNNMLFSQDGKFEVFTHPHLPDRDPHLKPRPRHPTLRGHGIIPRSRLYYTYLVSRVMEWLMRKVKGYEYIIGGHPLRLYPHDLAVRASLQNFVDTLRGKATLACPLSEAARTVATCLAGVESYRTGNRVKVSDYWLPEFGKPVERTTTAHGC